MAGVRALGIRGCSVSMPFKEAVIALVDTMEPSAAAIESVNTIVNDDRLTASNTDFEAVPRSWIDMLSIGPCRCWCTGRAAWPRQWLPLSMGQGLAT